MSPRHSHLVLGLAVTSTAAMLWAAQVTAPGAATIVPRSPLMPQQTRTLGPVFAQVFAPAPLVAMRGRRDAVWQLPIAVAAPRALAVTPAVVTTPVSRAPVAQVAPSTASSHAVVVATTSPPVVVAVQSGATPHLASTTGRRANAVVATQPVAIAPVTTVAATSAIATVLVAHPARVSPVAAQPVALPAAMPATQTPRPTTSVVSATVTPPAARVSPVVAVPAAVSLLRPGVAVAGPPASSEPTPVATTPSASVPAASLSPAPKISGTVTAGPAVVRAVVAVSSSQASQSHAAVAAPRAATAAGASVTITASHLQVQITATVTLSAHGDQTLLSLLAPRDRTLAQALATQGSHDWSHHLLLNLVSGSREGATPRS